MVTQGWDFNDMMNMKAKDLAFWYTEATKFYNKKNKAENG